MKTMVLILRSRNETFKPYLRRDLLTEKNILTGYEESIKGSGSDVDGMFSFSTIEPCPVCLARIITSRIRKLITKPRIRTVGWLFFGKNYLQCGGRKRGVSINVRYSNIFN